MTKNAKDRMAILFPYPKKYTCHSDIEYRNKIQEVKKIRRVASIGYSICMEEGNEVLDDLRRKYDLLEKKLKELESKDTTCGLSSY